MPEFDPQEFEAFKKSGAIQAPIFNPKEFEQFKEETIQSDLAEQQIFPSLALPPAEKPRPSEWIREELTNALIKPTKEPIEKDKPLSITKGYSKWLYEKMGGTEAVIGGISNVITGIEFPFEAGETVYRSLTEDPKLLKSFLIGLVRFAPDVLGNLVTATGANKPINSVLMGEEEATKMYEDAIEAVKRDPLMPLFAVGMLKAGKTKITRRALNKIERGKTLKDIESGFEEIAKEVPEMKSFMEKKVEKPIKEKPTEPGVSIKEKIGKTSPPLPIQQESKLQTIKARLTGKPASVIDKRSWEMVGDYYDRRYGTDWRLKDKWDRELREVFTKSEQQDMIAYRQGTGNLFKDRTDTYENVSKRLSPEAKKFVDKTIDQHMKEWKTIWNELPFTKNINAREEVMKTYLPGIYAGDINSAYDAIIKSRGRKFATHGFMLNKKKYLSYMQAFQEAGLTPRFNKIADLLEYHDLYMNRLVANNELLNNIHKLESDIGLKLAITSRSGKYQEAQNSGWVQFDDPFLRSYFTGRIREDGTRQFATTTAPALVHPELASAVQGIFTKEAFKRPKLPLRIYDATGDYLRYLRVSLSGWHFVPLAESLVGGKGFGALNVPKWIKESKKMLKDPVLMTEAKGAGLKIGAPTDVAKHRIERDISTFVNRLTIKGGIPKVAGVGVRIITAPQIKITRFLFDTYHPMLKIQMYEHYKTSYMQSLNKKNIFPNSIELNKIHREVAKVVNNQFGGQAWETMRYFNDPKVVRMAHRLIGYPDWCSDMDTRAMTKTGWKYYHELKIGDKIMIFDPQTKTNKWGNLNNLYINENYSGDMIRIKNYNRSIMVTPEHTCYVVHDKNRKNLIIKAKELNTHHLIPRCANFDLPKKEIYDDYFIKIVGWMITDGHINKGKRKLKDGTISYKISGRITQSKPLTVKIIKELGLKYFVEKYNSNHGKFISNYSKYVFYVPKNIITQMEKAGINDNMLSWEFLSKLTKRQLQLLYDTMIMGDGTGQNRFCGKKKEVFFMTLIQTMLGKPSTFYQQEKNCWRTRIIESHYITCGSRKPTRETYKGTIWCPSVETGFWLAERRGLIFITGNTISAIKQAAGAFKPGTQGYLARRYWIKYGIAFLAAQNSINYLNTGFYNDEEGKIRWSWDQAHSTFENPDPLHWYDFQIPNVNITIMGHTFNPGKNEKGRLLFSHLGKQMLEIGRYPTEPVSQAFSKSNPVIQIVGTQILGGRPYKDEIFPARGKFVGGDFKPWSGTKPWTYERTKERIKEALHGFMPFSVQQVAERGFATFGVLPISQGLGLRTSEDYMEKAIKNKDYQMLKDIKRVLYANGYKISQIARTESKVRYNIAIERREEMEKRTK